MNIETVKCCFKVLGCFILGMFIVGPILMLFGKYMEWFAGLIGL